MTSSFPHHQEIFMKRIIVLVFGFTFLVSMSHAAVGFGGGAQAGISISSFPKAISDGYGMGFGFGAHGDVNIIKFLTLRLNFDYHIFPSKKDKIRDDLAAANAVNASDITVEGLNANIVGITVNGIAKLPTGSSVTPYGLLGFGMHIASVSDLKVTYQGQPVTVTGTSGLGSDTNFGMNFGAGSEFGLGNVKLYFEVEYVLIFSSGSSTGHIPITVGVTI